MGNSYTTQQALQIVNSPAVAYLRAFGSSDSYVKSVFTNSMSFSAAPEQFTQSFDDTGDVYDAIAAETAELSFDTALMFDPSYMELIGGGLFTKTTTAGGTKAVDNQVIAADWTNKKAIEVLLSDDDGKYIANGAPAITSVTGSVAGVLAADDDYVLVVDPNSYSGYSIILNTAGSAGLVTTETVTIVFNSPTIVGETVVDFGGIKNYEPVEGYIETINRAGKTVRIEFYKAYYDGNWNMSGAAENSPEAALSSFTFSIKPDTTRAAGQQLYRFSVSE